MIAELGVLVASIGVPATVLVMIAVGAVLLAHGQNRRAIEDARRERLFNDRFEAMTGEIDSLRDELKAERAARQADKADSEGKIISLQQTQADAVARAERERAARRQAEHERDTLKLENTQLLAKLDGIQQTQAETLERVAELERDKEERRLRHQAEIEAERARVEDERRLRLQRERELGEMRAETARLNAQVQTLEEQVRELRHQTEPVTEEGAGDDQS